MESRGVPVSKLTYGLYVMVFVYPAREVADECPALCIVIDGTTSELWCRCNRRRAKLSDRTPVLRGRRESGRTHELTLRTLAQRLIRR